MTIRELIKEIEHFKTLIEPKDWESFKDEKILVMIDGKDYDLEMTGICGSYLPFGYEALIQNKKEIT